MIWREASPNEEMSLNVQRISLYVTHVKRITNCEGTKNTAPVLTCITSLETENVTRLYIIYIILVVQAGELESEPL
jgi:hypothetical protein